MHDTRTRTHALTYVRTHAETSKHQCPTVAYDYANLTDETFPLTNRILTCHKKSVNHILPTISTTSRQHSCVWLTSYDNMIYLHAVSSANYRTCGGVVGRRVIPIST